MARYPNLSLLDIIVEVSNRNPMFLADNASIHTPALNDKADRTADRLAANMYDIESPNGTTGHFGLKEGKNSGILVCRETTLR